MIDPTKDHEQTISELTLTVARLTGRLEDFRREDEQRREAVRLNKIETAKQLGLSEHTITMQVELLGVKDQEIQQLTEQVGTLGEHVQALTEQLKTLEAERDAAITAASPEGKE